jgi:hypothetical protein
MCTSSPTGSFSFTRMFRTNRGRSATTHTHTHKEEQSRKTHHQYEQKQKKFAGECVRLCVCVCVCCACNEIHIELCEEKKRNELKEHNKLDANTEAGMQCAYMPNDKAPKERSYRKHTHSHSGIHLRAPSALSTPHTHTHTHIHTYTHTHIHTYTYTLRTRTHPLSHTLPHHTMRAKTHRWKNSQRRKETYTH